MSLKYFCNYCDFSSSTNAVVNHILEHHINKLESINLSNGIKGNLISSKICTEKSKDPDIIFCCFGCKKFWARATMGEKHKLSCNKKQEHSNICKKILETYNETETLVNNYDIELLKKIEKLEKRVKELEEDNKENEEGKMKYDVLTMTLIEYLDRYTREKIADVLTYNMTEGEKEHEIDWYSELITYRESTNHFA